MAPSMLIAPAGLAPVGRAPQGESSLTARWSPLGSRLFPACADGQWTSGGLGSWCSRRLRRPGGLRVSDGFEPSAFYLFFFFFLACVAPTRFLAEALRPKTDAGRRLLFASAMYATRDHQDRGTDALDEGPQLPGDRGSARQPGLANGLQTLSRSGRALRVQRTSSPHRLTTSANHMASFLIPGKGWRLCLDAYGLEPTPRPTFEPACGSTIRRGRQRDGFSDLRPLRGVVTFRVEGEGGRSRLVDAFRSVPSCSGRPIDAKGLAFSSVRNTGGWRNSVCGPRRLSSRANCRCECKDAFALSEGSLFDPSRASRQGEGWVW
jgi:hypothetical protein